MPLRGGPLSSLSGGLERYIRRPGVNYDNRGMTNRKQNKCSILRKRLLSGFCASCEDWDAASHVGWTNFSVLINARIARSVVHPAGKVILLSRTGDARRRVENLFGATPCGGGIRMHEQKLPTRSGEFHLAQFGH